jgi:hypothetical protein
MIYGKCYEPHERHLISTHNDPTVCERFMLIYHSDGPTGQPYTRMIPVSDGLTYANESERWKADCVAAESRRNRLLEKYQKQSPCITRLMETFISWGSNRRVVVTLEMDQGRKIQEILGKTYQTVLRSVVRTQFVSFVPS